MGIGFIVDEVYLMKMKNVPARYLIGIHEQIFGATQLAEAWRCFILERLNRSGGAAA